MYTGQNPTLLSTPSPGFLTRSPNPFQDKQQHFQAAMNDPVQTPERAPRLFDLITFAAERVKPAFWYALRNTLVAENLDQAQRIAYGPDKRFRRVVTLQGQVG